MGNGLYLLILSRYKTEDGKAFNVLGTLENDGISGLWVVGRCFVLLFYLVYKFILRKENPSLSLGVVQKGGGRLLIQHGANLYPGVMNGNFAVSPLYTYKSSFLTLGIYSRFR